MSNPTKLKSREKLALSRLENLNTFELNELLFKDAIRHLYSNKFYIAMDETPIEKAFAYLDKNGIIPPAMQGLQYIIDNAKKDGSKIIKGYNLFTVVAISNDGNSTFLIGAAIMHHHYSISKNLIIKSVLEPIFYELKKLKKIPISILADSGYDDKNIYKLINKHKFNFTIKYSNVRYFHKFDKDINKITMNMTLETLYKSIKHDANIKFYNHEGTLVHGKVKYASCFINNFNKGLNIVMLKLDNEISAVITSNTVTDDEDAIHTIYRYNRRWNIELIFAFLKDHFKMEKYLVRSLKKMINLFLLIMIVCNFYGMIWHTKSKFKEELIQLAEPFHLPKFGLWLIVMGIKKLYQPNLSII